VATTALVRRTTLAVTVLAAEPAAVTVGVDAGAVTAEEKGAPTTSTSAAPMAPAAAAAVTRPARLDAVVEC